MTNLKKYRCAAGLSQFELARASGVSVRVLQNYEQGVRDICKASAETVMSIAKALNMTIEDLIT